MRALQGMRRLVPRTEEYGRAFEHFVIEEVRAYLSYRERLLPLAYWRTSTGLEVDLVIGQLDAAIEIKATESVRPEHLKGLRALSEDQPVRRSYVVSLEPEPRQVGDVLILPWREFCTRLWADEIV